MAHIYVDSAAAGAGTGADWANAYTTLKAAAEAGGTAAGDSLWVAHSHAETQASTMTITFKNTFAAPGTVLCVNTAGSVPPVAADLRTTATVTTTGASGLRLTGVAYLYGIIFSAVTGAGAEFLNIAYNNSWQYFKNCALRNMGTGGGGMQVGIVSYAQRAFFDNTVLTFGGVGQSLNITNAELVWKNTPSALGGAVFPTTLFIGGGLGIVTLEGVDLSAMTVGKTIVGVFDQGGVVVRNCNLDAGVTLATVPSGGRTGMLFINSDGADTNYRAEKVAYAGSQSIDLAVVLTGGASDGVTPISWRLETTADAELVAPFESLPISVWNDVTGSRTVTVQGIWGGGAVPNNNDIWMEVEYLGTSGFPQSVFASTGLANVLATPAALPAGDGTWGGSTTKFKMASTVTIAKKGPVTVRIYAAAISSIFFIDPKVTLS